MTRKYSYVKSINKFFPNLRSHSHSTNHSDFMLFLFWTWRPCYILTKYITVGPRLRLFLGPKKNSLNRKNLNRGLCYVLMGPRKPKNGLIPSILPYCEVYVMYWWDHKSPCYVVIWLLEGNIFKQTLWLKMEKWNL